MTSRTRGEISSESYITPFGETLPGAGWPKPLLTMRATTRIGIWNVSTPDETSKNSMNSEFCTSGKRNAPLWHCSVRNLRKHIEWIWLHNNSNRRAGGVPQTWEWTACAHRRSGFYDEQVSSKSLSGFLCHRGSSLHDSTLRAERSPS